MATAILNQLPVPTYGWLQVNRTERDLPDTAPQELALRPAEGEAVHLTLTESRAITVSGSKNAQIFMQIAPEESALIQTTIKAEANAALRLVQIFTGAQSISKVNAELAENASLELVQLYLNTADAVSDVQVALDGRKSAFTSHIGYDLSRSDNLDINLNILHRGKKTESKTTVRGVMREQSHKVFRGTIDFQQGAAGAKGAEQEDVLLLDPTVVNKTVPVILCAEEDVEGAHGASVGQLDAAHIFYLQSRGIPLEQIYQLMAQAKLGSIIRQIGDAETEQAVQEALGIGGGDAED